MNDTFNGIVRMYENEIKIFCEKEILTNGYCDEIKLKEFISKLMEIKENETNKNCNV
jgi:hypothetical protein